MVLPSSGQEDSRAKFDLGFTIDMAVFLFIYVSFLLWVFPMISTLLSRSGARLPIAAEYFWRLDASLVEHFYVLFLIAPVLALVDHKFGIRKSHKIFLKILASAVIIMNMAFLGGLAAKCLH